jgi:hypothetical protein
MDPTTSYRGSGTPAEQVSPPAAVDDPPLTPNSSLRRRTASNPTAASLLHEDEKNEELPQSNEGSRDTHREDFENSANEGRRATIRGMLCRKSKAFMFGQLLSLFLVSRSITHNLLVFTHAMNDLSFLCDLQINFLGGNWSCAISSLP